MKKHLLILTTLLLTLTVGHSQTNVSGGNVSGTWTLAGSPYFIQGAIMIADDTTLIIDPGVVVEFQGYYKFLVLGQLLAVGTMTDTITFTATDTTTGWLGIHFDNTPITNDTSRIFFCKLQFTKNTSTNGGALYFNNFSKCVISSCKISNNQFSNVNIGGGINCGNSTPLIRSNNITNNNCAGIYGGFNTTTPLTIYNNVITNNQGYGIYCGDGSIINNTINYNIGGGIFCNNSNVINNTINSNGSIGGWVGAIRGFSGSVLTIDNNQIIGNLSADGGGIYCINSNPVIITNNTISNNEASNNGGGIICGNNIDMNNNAIINNSAINGGGIYNNNFNSQCVFTNNTIANNQSEKGGGIFFTSNSSLNTTTLVNNIFWGNMATNSGDQVYIDVQTSKPNFSYCDVQGGISAFGLTANVFYLGTYTNDLDTDPQFVNPSGGSGIGFNGVVADWSLQSGSPCIDAGDTVGLYPLTDIAGNPRVMGSFIDIGAFEFQGILGISNYDLQNQINAFPNPFSSSTILQTDKFFKEATLTVYNSFDQTVKQIKNISCQTIILHRFNLPSGLYFIRLTEDNKIILADKLVITD